MKHKKKTVDPFTIGMVVFASSFIIGLILVIAGYFGKKSAKKDSSEYKHYSTVLTVGTVLVAIPLVLIFGILQYESRPLVY